MDVKVSDKEYLIQSTTQYDKCLDRLLQSQSNAWNLICTIAAIFLTGYSVMATTIIKNDCYFMFKYAAMFILTSIIVKNYFSRFAIERSGMLFYDIIKRDILEYDRAEKEYINNQQKEVVRIKKRIKLAYYCLVLQLIFIFTSVITHSWRMCY